MFFLMLIWLVRWYNIQSPILHDHTEVGGHARANSEAGGVDLGWPIGIHIALLVIYIACVVVRLNLC